MHHQHRSHIPARNYCPEGIQQTDDNSKPPFISHLEFAIGFSKVEILLKEWLDIGMFGDAAGAIRDVLEILFRQIIPVHSIEEAIVGIGRIVFVLG